MMHLLSTLMVIFTYGQALPGQALDRLSVHKELKVFKDLQVQLVQQVLPQQLLVQLVLQAQLEKHFVFLAIMQHWVRCKQQIQ
jgi:hypothetical protein